MLQLLLLYLLVLQVNSLGKFPHGRQNRLEISPEVKRFVKNMVS